MTGAATKILYVVTDSQTSAFLTGGMAHLVAAGFAPTVVSSDGPALRDLARSDGIDVVGLKMARNPAPARDLVSLGRLILVMRQLRPTIVAAGTPKAGLLGVVAAWITRVPVRCYFLWGLRLETTRGPKRLVLRTLEYVACRLATNVYAVSDSLKNAVVQLGLCEADRVRVLGQGSSHGVDISRFNFSEDDRRQRRAEIGIGPDEFVVGFVGRLSRDKGAEDLLPIWTSVRRLGVSGWLVVIGDVDPADPPAPTLAAMLSDSPSVAWLGRQESAPWFQAFDVLLLPTRREGFPNVVLEAGACGVPTCAYRVTGARDAVIDGVTGALAETGDREGMADSIAAYASDPARRRTHGESARDRVMMHFRTENVWQRVSAEFGQLAARQHV